MFYPEIFINKVKTDICQNLLGDWNYLQETQEVTIRPGAFKFPVLKKSDS